MDTLSAENKTSKRIREKNEGETEVGVERERVRRMK